MRVVAVAIAAVLALAACSHTYTVGDPVTRDVMGKCHADLANSFCVVASPPGTTVVSGKTGEEIVSGGLGIAASAAKVVP